MKIVHHRDLIEGLLSFNAWKSDESFPIAQLDTEGINTLRKFEIVEHIFDGMQSQRSESNFRRLIEAFVSELRKILSQDKRTKYLFAIEHNSSLVSKLRSYKKFVDRSKIESTQIFEKEIFISDRESRFAFICRVTDSNFDYLTKFLFDSSYCFLISSEDDLLNESSLDRITSLFKLSGTTHVNFLKAMLEFCSAGDYIYRIGGGDGEEYWSLQILKAK